jgi:hypothetical protein
LLQSPQIMRFANTPSEPDAQLLVMKVAVGGKGNNGEDTEVRKYGSTKVRKYGSTIEGKEGKKENIGGGGITHIYIYTYIHLHIYIYVCVCVCIRIYKRIWGRRVCVCVCAE